MDALLELPDIRYVLALQEASAVAMADGYAQVNIQSKHPLIHRNNLAKSFEWKAISAMAEIKRAEHRFATEIGNVLVGKSLSRQFDKIF